MVPAASEPPKPAFGFGTRAIASRPAAASTPPAPPKEGRATSATETAARECRLFIGGDWVAPQRGGLYDDLDPFTGDVVARVAAGGREDARRAIAAAAAAYPSWSHTPPA